LGESGGQLPGMRPASHALLTLSSTSPKLGVDAADGAIGLGEVRPPDEGSRPLASVIGPRWVGMFVRAAIAAVAAGLALSFLFDDQGTTWLLLAVEALLLVSLKFTNLGRTTTASWTLLLSVTALFCYQAAISGGLRDEVILAFPCLLIFASMFGTRKHYLIILGLLIGAMALITTLNLSGWHVNPPQATSWISFAYLLFILLVTAFFLWVFARDLRLTVADLRWENQRLSASHARIDRLAHHDSLTGLPNRVLARLRVEQAIASAKRSGRSVAVIFLDLDDFKAINDSLGHVAADELLRVVAARLSGVVRGCDTVSRQGGDEFLVVLEAVHDQQEVALAATRIIDGFSRSISIHGVELFITSSLGIAMYPRSGGDFDTLLKNADMAMYQAKDSGRNTFRFYDERVGNDVKEGLGLVAAIRSALANHEFELHYQPLIELASGRVVGAEALIRWRHPELGSIPPAKFIPLAERSGLIADVGRWVLNEACRRAREWQLAGASNLVVSVNISPVQFRREDLEQDVLDAITHSGLPPRLLELELTESVLVADTEQLSGLIGRLHAKGLRFAIDDFGVGYSNLSYLRRFEVDRLKVDQSFVRRMTSDEGDESIVRAIIDVANKLKLETVGEGVEDAATLERLISVGCRFGQGYFWSPALPPAEFFEFLRAHQAFH
jgi:diguanylate cyclase (GGDEF)-like protein